MHGEGRKTLDRGIPAAIVNSMQTQRPSQAPTLTPSEYSDLMAELNPTTEVPVIAPQGNTDRLLDLVFGVDLSQASLAEGSQ